MNEVEGIRARVTVLETFHARTLTIIDELTELDRAQGVIEARRARLLADAADEAALYAGDPYVLDPQGACRSGVAREIGLATLRSEKTVLRMMDTAQCLVLDLPGTFAALAGGRVLYGHAQHMATHTSLLPAEARAAFEDTVLPIARTMPAYRFGEKARQTRELTHPETMVARAKRARADRSVTLQHERDGMSSLWCTLPAADAIAIDDLIDRTARAEAAQGHTGDDPDTRTHTQRRADVFTRLLLDPDGVGSTVVPTVIITAPAATIAGVTDEPGHLHGYGAIDPDTTRLIAQAAPTFLRVLTHAVSRAPTLVTRHRGRAIADSETDVRPATDVYPTDVYPATDIQTVPDILPAAESESPPPTANAPPITGRERYSAPPDLRLVLAIEDETCRFPHCSTRANRCELDHTRDWAHGGTTTPDNLAYLCRKHHHLKHDSGWTVVADPEHPRHLVWTSPAGRVYTTAPARTG